MSFKSDTQKKYFATLAALHPLTLKRLSIDAQNADGKDIDRIKVFVKQKYGYNGGSIRGAVAEALEIAGLNAYTTENNLKSGKHGTKVCVNLVFTRNPRDGEDGRQALPNYEQIERLAPTISEVRDRMISKGFKQGEAVEMGEVEAEEIPEDTEKENDDDRKKRPKIEQDVLALIEWVQNTVRPFLLQHKAPDGKPIDEWGMRQVLDGTKMLKAGIPLTAVKHAATLHFPPEARRSLTVTTYDVTTYKKGDQVVGMHKALPYVRSLMNAGINIALIGGKGTGKTTFVEMLANLDEKPHVAVSCNPSTGPSDFYGIQKIGGDGGVISAEFTKGVESGAYILLDEMDAADESLLLMLNRLLANRKFYHRLMGRELEVHEDTRFFAGMNTMGTGGGSRYTGRNKQDAAAMDRWSMGRVQLDLDADLERKLALDLVGADN